MKKFIKYLFDIKPLYKLSIFFAITPLYNFNKKQVVYIKSYKIFSMIMFFLIKISFLCNIYPKIYYAKYLSIIFTGIIASTLVHLINMLAILNQVKFKKDNWATFLKQIEETEFKGLHMNLCRIFIGFAYFMISAVLVYVILATYFLFHYKYILLYMLFHVQEFLMQIMILVVCYYALKIKSRYDRVSDVINTNLLNEKYIQRKLKAIFYTCLKLNKIVDCFNEIFGMVLFIYLGLTWSSILDALNNLLNFETSILSYFITVTMLCYRTVNTIFMFFFGLFFNK